MKIISSLFFVLFIQVSTYAQTQKPSIWSQWPALDEYHKVMAMTFHPAENGDIEAVRKNAADLASQSKLLAKSTIPTALYKDGMESLVKQLKKESGSLSKMVKAKKTDAELKTAIFALHDRFHEIVEKCVH